MQPHKNQKQVIAVTNNKLLTAKHKLKIQEDAVQTQVIQSHKQVSRIANSISILNQSYMKTNSVTQTSLKKIV
jgi:hypothetical protein